MDLDAWVREIVEWHFSPETGCPFWLDYAARLGWDPRREIRSYDDLARFGFFEREWLRSPASRWVPKAYAGRPVHLFESRIDIDDFRTDYEAFSATLPDEHFPKGADWLMAAPTGPRRLRLAVEHLVQHRGGICFMVDLDPRWIGKVTRLGQTEMLERYKAHVIDQALTLLRAHPNIHCLFATPPFLEALCEKVLLKQVGIQGVVCGGAEITPQFYRNAVEELLSGVYLALAFDHPLAGMALHKPADAEDH